MPETKKAKLENVLLPPQDKAENKGNKKENRLGGEQITLHQSMIPPNTIKQRHIEAMIIFSGTNANKPADGSTEIKAYYAFDQKKLYIWNTTNEAWEYASFT